MKVAGKHSLPAIFCSFCISFYLADLPIYAQKLATPFFKNFFPARIAAETVQWGGSRVQMPARLLE